ncbi:MAG: hypothetical protein R2874_04870 [Desulfobacterales bacterium]
MTKPSTESWPTVFHITHYKSGSQWVLAVLNEVAENRIIAPQVGAAHVTDQPMMAGMEFIPVSICRSPLLRHQPAGK